jgi:hypothetical protein
MRSLGEDDLVSENSALFKLHPVACDPFEHIVVDDYLDAEFYRALATSFPLCAANTGPTGYTCFWGDPEYDQLLAGSPAWRRLFDVFHSQHFVTYALGQFADAFAEECHVDLSQARYVPHLENRRDKERRSLPRNTLAPEDLWVRVDIMQGHAGYDRAPHLDHRRRALTMLIYFSDADEIAMQGGDLLLHGAPDTEPLRLRPRENRMVAFACTPRSFHSVSPIVSQAKPRNFVQVLLSSSADLWSSAQWPGETVDRGVFGLARRAKRFARRRTRLGPRIRESAEACLETACRILACGPDRDRWHDRAIQAGL